MTFRYLAREVRKSKAVAYIYVKILNSNKITLLTAKSNISMKYRILNNTAKQKRIKIHRYIHTIPAFRYSL